MRKQEEREGERERWDKCQSWLTSPHVKRGIVVEEGTQSKEGKKKGGLNSSSGLFPKVL